MNTDKRVNLVGMVAIAAMSMMAGIGAQEWQRDSRDWQWDGNSHRLSWIAPGTFLDVRTTEPIDSSRADGRIFYGVIKEDVWDDYRRLAVPAIPAGSRVELIVRSAADGDLILDLESVLAHGQRYAIDARSQRIESRGPNHDLLGAVLGTITGDRGRFVRLPAGSVLPFRLQRGLSLGVADGGFNRDRYHYHRDDDRYAPDRQ